MGWLSPQETVDEQELRRGMRVLLYDGTCSQVMGSLTGGAFLVAFALYLGASNAAIGVIAGIQPLMQILQIPATVLVDRTRRRKLLVVCASFLARVFWPAVALLPWLAPKGLGPPLLIFGLLGHFGFAAISTCSFNSWMRDLIPEEGMGRYFGKRLAIGTTVGAVVMVIAGSVVDFATEVGIEPIKLYSSFFIIGGCVGFVGVYFLSRIPEPRMATSGGSIVSILLEPLRDQNFRKLLMFLGSWNFAINLAAPFFTVYMIKRLHLPMSWIVALVVLSQAFNAWFLQVWGKLADRYSNKSVLSVAGSLFIFSIALWPFTTMPERYVLTVPLLVAIHVLAGTSTAGVTLCSGNIALKLAPRGKATAFLATNALINGIAASLAPSMSGLSADFFESKRLSLELHWGSTANSNRLLFGAINLEGLDFVFAIAFVLGLYALHRLLAVREEGEVHEDIVATEFYAEVRKAVRSVSTVAGLRHLTYFPYGILKQLKGLSRGARRAVRPGDGKQGDAWPGEVDTTTPSDET